MVLIPFIDIHWKSMAQADIITTKFWCLTTKSESGDEAVMGNNILEET